MDHEFEYAFTIKPDLKTNCTYVELTIPLSKDGQDFQHLDWENYCGACRASLHALATQHRREIIVWSVDFDESGTSITHAVAVRGVLFGVVPLRIVRALRPSRAYRTLAFLSRAVRNDWRTRSALREAVETQRLHRYDHGRKRLGELIESQLLMRTLTETYWTSLISPSDKPWAYINTATKRIYERHYQPWEDCNDGTSADTGDREHFESCVANGDELTIADIPKTLRAAGFANDAIAVLNAKTQGRQSDLRSNLMDGTGKSMSARQVEALRGKLRRGQERIRTAVMAASTWKAGSSNTMVYRERVPDGELWQGLWTYSHKYQGEDLEMLWRVMCDERRSLYKY